MKRFLIFTGDQYYPLGGWRDLFGQADSLEDALSQLARRESGGGSLTWWQIVDCESAAIVAMHPDLV